jgi:hypothetical protein
MLLLLRCFALLLNPAFDVASFPIVYHPYLMEQMRKLVSEIPLLHFSTLAPFLHNYTVFISHTQLISHRVREEHLRVLATFIARCMEHKEAAEVPSALESALISVGNLLIAQPVLTPLAQDTIAPFLPEFKSILMAPSLLTDLEQLLKRPVPLPTLPRAGNLLRE